MQPVQNKKKKVNPHCPVPGCRTDKPHAGDPIVKGMIVEYAPPEKMTFLGVRCHVGTWPIDFQGFG